jgi:hypothetical protein
MSRTLAILVGLFGTAAVGPSSSWDGVWRVEDKRIRIEHRGKTILVKGSAVWHGYGDNTHIGQFSGHAVADGDALVVHDEDVWLCVVRLRLVGKRLVVSEVPVPETGHCGGANVSFNGEYHRR